MCVCLCVLGLWGTPVEFFFRRNSFLFLLVAETCDKSKHFFFTIILATAQQTDAILNQSCPLSHTSQGARHLGGPPRSRQRHFPGSLPLFSWTRSGGRPLPIPHPRRRHQRWSPSESPAPEVRLVCRGICWVPRAVCCVLSLHCSEARISWTWMCVPSHTCFYFSCIPNGLLLKSVYCFKFLVETL